MLLAAVLTGWYANVPAPATATPQATTPQATVVASQTAASAQPQAVTTVYAAGASAMPETGGMTLHPPAQSGPLAGKVITLDPGHNGKWVTEINLKSVQSAAGWRPCQLGGTSTLNNVPEAQVTWEVANQVARLLLDRGATVVLTRANNDGVGPCNNERAEINNRESGSLLLSIHADGNDGADMRGFHVIASGKMLGGDPTQASSLAAAGVVAQHMAIASGLPAANYAGHDGLATRNDLAVLNGVTASPAIMVEIGNGKNPADAEAMTTPAGQQRIAVALADACEQIVLA